MSLHNTSESTDLRRQLDEEYADVTPPKPKLLIHTDNAPESTATDSSIAKAPAPMGMLIDTPKPGMGATPAGCPTSIVHDPREVGNRLYMAYYPTQGGAPGVVAPRGFAASPKDFLSKMHQLEKRPCGIYAPPIFERRQVQSQVPAIPRATPQTVSQCRAVNTTCPLWRNVALAMVGATVGYLVVQRLYKRK
jgi:hypothetical protein